MNVEKAEKQGYIGIDASLDESLNSYGLIGKELKPDLWHFIYVVAWKDHDTPKLVDGIDVEVVEDLAEVIEESWFEKEEFLSCCGLTEKEFLQSSPVSQAHDLLGYYGYQNIFGDSYYPATDIDGLLK